MFKLFSEFFAPITETGAGGSGPALEDRSMSKEDMLDFLNEETPTEPEVIDLENKGGKKATQKTSEEKPEETETSEEETPEGESEEVDELAELEAELQEPTEEQLELVTPVRRKEILAKYPQLFKDFPYLEKAYFRDAAFTEMFTTPAEAQEAVQAKETLDNFEKDIMGGNITTILASVKEENPESFNKVVDNYMEALYQVDQPAYYHLIGNISKNVIVGMLKEARNAAKPEIKEALETAAQTLNQYLFGTSEWRPPSKLSKETTREENGREQEQTRREQEFNRRQFEGARGDLNTRVNNTITNTIKSHIDPRGTMTEYVRNAAMREVSENLTRLIAKDTRFSSLNDKLWEASFKEGFSSESKDRILRAYLSKAKTVLPALIKQARINAMRGSGRRVNTAEEAEQPEKKGPLPAGRPRSQQSSGKIKEAKDIPKGMRTLDFLNQD